MVKHTDVRIGNWVSYNGKPYQIETIAKEYPTLNTDEFGIGVVDWNNIEPIPITLELLLLNCGFKKYLLSNPYWVKNENICVSVMGSIEILHEYRDSYNLKYTINSLHKLQNLFYENNRKELEITL